MPATKHKKYKFLEPELVRVRATERGQYAILRRDQDTGELGRNATVINPGEVFMMDVQDMKPPAKYTAEQLEGTETVESATRGKFVLPSWVTLVKKNERIDDHDSTLSGHQKTFAAPGSSMDPTGNRNVLG